jgi:DNA-binding LytR/AlgR family response regulator
MKITINTDERFTETEITVNCNRISGDIESTDKRCFLYTATDVFESPIKLCELEEKLAGKDFMRASKNCLFNINHIQSIEPDIDRKLILSMVGGLKIVVSRQYSSAVKKKLEA